MSEAAERRRWRKVTSAGESETIRAALSAIRAMAPFGGAQFACSCDPHRDRVRVKGYFPDQSVVDRMREIHGVTVAVYPINQQPVPPSPHGWGSAALARWSDFPVGQWPRPLVVLEPRLRYRQFVNSIGGVRNTHDRTPIRVRVETDRGNQEVTAIVAEGVDPGLVQVTFDPADSVWWPRTDEDWNAAHQHGQAQLDPDGRRLHLRVHGGRTTEFLSVESEESPTAVVVKPVSRNPMGLGRAVRVSRTTTCELPNPLGGRVLVDQLGTPIRVVPTGTERLPPQAAQGLH